MVINSVLLVKRTEKDYSTAKEATSTGIHSDMVYLVGNAPDYSSDEYVADKVLEMDTFTYVLGPQSDSSIEKEVTYVDAVCGGISVIRLCATDCNVGCIYSKLSSSQTYIIGLESTRNVGLCKNDNTITAEYTYTEPVAV